MLKIIAAFFVFAFLTPSLEAQNVSISELMAAGQEVLSDGDGDFPDWIELHNSGSTTVNLTGWHLTDDDALPKKWTFPAVNIPPGGYLVVFASAKNRRAAGQELHTNFSLAADGEYLAPRHFFWRGRPLFYDANSGRCELHTIHVRRECSCF